MKENRLNKDELSVMQALTEIQIHQNYYLVFILQNTHIVLFTQKKKSDGDVNDYNC